MTGVPASRRIRRTIVAASVALASFAAVGSRAGADTPTPVGGTFTEAGSTFVVQDLPASDVSPDAPADLNPPAPSASTDADPDAPSAAAGTCYGYGAPSGHAYSVGYTSCGTADGVYADWTPHSSPGWNIDPCCSDSHVNATIWYSYFTSSGAYQGLELGYWRANSGATNQCYYAGTFIGNTYTGHCLIHAGASPTGATLWIQSSAKNSKTYRVYVNDTYKASYTLGVTASHRLDSGYEEQADDLISGGSSNLSPSARFDGLLYHSQSNQTWYNWGHYSHCFVSYSKGESFGPDTFATSHESDIGGSAGSYAGCNGSAPTSPRTSW